MGMTLSSNIISNYNNKNLKVKKIRVKKILCVELAPSKIINNSKKRFNLLITKKINHRYLPRLRKSLKIL